jgi:hypothetical protein
MVKKAMGSFLKAQDVIKVVTSLKVQAIFIQKGISKPLISTRTALHWLKKLGWSYGKFRNGIYLNRHKRSDMVAYRQGFVNY